MGKLFVVGIGPGSYENMTMRAQQALAGCDIIVGYNVYVDLVKEHFADKEFLTTPMRREVERCELALEKAAEGNTVAMICSGDAGVYGMSGLIEELAVKYPDVEIETVPGVSAVLSGAAVLGAALMHDFAVISLSDWLTPWEKIEKRLAFAAQADFVMCFYNPSSHVRKDYLQKACDILLQYISPETVCGIVKNIGREGQEATVLTLGELRNTPVDMFSTVFIGNSQTMKLGNKMVTPRGYKHE
ncbi:MAG: precorrin-3B C(17)-methyltransferase [Eubacterium sp.]|nr:precorrin-3B C(17)-methyltransferase [Eubacterium sp.]